MTIIVQAASTATSANYSSKYDWIMPDLPMCPLALVDNAIRDTVIDLCERALIWRAELQQILVLADTSTTLTAAAAASATTITVASITDFADGDTITVTLDDTTKWRGHVSGTPSGLVITLDGGLTSAAASGNAVTKLTYLYPITTPSNSVMAKVLKAWLNDSVIEPLSEDDLDTEFNATDFGWVGVNWRTDVSLPTRYYMADESTIGLALAPNATGNLRIWAALKPTRASTTFPSWITERYIETIAHGVKGRIMMIPTKPYSNPKLAVYHKDEYERGVGTARVRQARSMTRAPLRNHSVFSLR